MKLGSCDDLIYEGLSHASEIAEIHKTANEILMALPLQMKLDILREKNYELEVPDILKKIYN
ncbi:MAG: hypothetical protein WC788_08260 [Candidatus Paceibacterota bacterium]|jgi:hypothetical protein